MPIFLYFIFRNSGDIDYSKRKYILIMTLLLSICSALRHQYMGNDTYGYMYEYEMISTSSWSNVLSESLSIFQSDSDANGRDPGYLLIVKLFSCIISFRSFQFLVALLLLSAIGFFIYSYVENLSGYIISYSFYVSLFYHYLPNSATRQTIAIGLLMWAYIIWFYKNRKIIPIIFFLIAFSVHKSVVLGLLPFVLNYFSNSKKINKYAIIGWAAVLLAGQKFSLLFATVLDSDTYLSYANSSAYSMSSKPVMFIVQLFAIYVLSFFCDFKIDDRPNLNKLVYICFYLGIVTSPIILVSPSQIRGAAYFTIFGIFFIPNIVENVTIPQRSLVFWMLIALTLGRPLLQGIPDFNFMWDSMVSQSIH